MVPFILVKDLWYEKFFLPREPLLSLEPELDSEANERQDLATILYRLAISQEEKVSLSSVLPGLVLLEGNEDVMVLKPKSCLITCLRTQVLQPADINNALKECPNTNAFRNGKSASFGDSFIILELADEWVLPASTKKEQQQSISLTHAIVIVQSKRKETAKKRRETDGEFDKDRQKAFLDHMVEFQRYRMLPIFVYITDATNVRLESEIGPYQCLINSEKHVSFYGSYRTKLRELRNLEDDDPMIQMQKNARNRRRREKRKMQNNEKSSSKALQQQERSEILAKLATKQRLTKVHNNSLKDFCKYYHLEPTHWRKNDMIRAIEHAYTEKQLTHQLGEEGEGKLEDRRKGKLWEQQPGLRHKVARSLKVQEEEEEEEGTVHESDSKNDSGVENNSTSKRDLGGENDSDNVAVSPKVHDKKRKWISSEAKTRAQEKAKHSRHVEKDREEYREQQQHKKKEKETETEERSNHSDDESKDSSASSDEDDSGNDTC